MKVLVLGGDGMLGHQLLKTLGSQHEVFVTLKSEKEDCVEKSIYTDKNTFFGVDLLNDFALIKVIHYYRPDVIVNSSGIIKYRPKSQDKVASLQVNALLPHRLAVITKDLGVRVIQFSTDCVFTGESGNYNERDLPDSSDTYGQTKFFGEITDEQHCLTLRTSFFGLELKYFTGLVEWFLRSKGKIAGYSRAIYSGLSTQEMARVVNKIISSHADLHGLYHLSSDPINKYDLLTKLKELLSRDDISIEQDNSVVIDRSLDSSHFRNATSYVPPAWTDMLQELSLDIQAREQS